jgi:hypothetical protein
VSFRSKVLERDEVCLCGQPATEAHHIYPKAKYPEFKDLVYNGIGLCARCHRAIYGIEEEMIEIYLRLRPEQSVAMSVALTQLAEARGVKMGVRICSS